MDINFILATINSAIRSSTPIMMAALGSAICNRVGVFNVALEGQMLIGSFTAIALNWYTGSILLSAVGGILAGGLIGLIVGILQVRFKAADMVVGTSMFLLVSAFTSVMLPILFGVKGSFKDPALLPLPKVSIPVIKDIPFISLLLRNLTTMDYMAYAVAVLMSVYLFRTVSGYHILSVGVKPEAAKSMGLPVKKIQILAVAFSGILCGFGGVVLSMGQVRLFAEGMTSGRGFIGMAACNLGASNPVGIILASLFFGFCDSFATIAQNNIPSQLTQAVPYIATIIALVAFSKPKRKKVKEARM